MVIRLRPCMNIEYTPTPHMSTLDDKSFWFGFRPPLYHWAGAEYYAPYEGEPEYKSNSKMTRGVIGNDGSSWEVSIRGLSSTGIHGDFLLEPFYRELATTIIHDIFCTGTCHYEKPFRGNRPPRELATTAIDAMFCLECARRFTQREGATATNFRCFLLQLYVLIPSSTGMGDTY